MKMKELLSVVFLLSLVVSFTSVVPNINAMEIPEGAVIKTATNPDVYVVKYKNGKQFKRLVLNPQVFESYGHLRWEDILIVSQSEMDSFVVSDLVRVDGQTDIYQLVPNDDVGNKHLLVSTVGHDLDLVYTINGVDFGNYVIGGVAGVTTQQQLETQSTSSRIDKLVAIRIGGGIIWQNWDSDLEKDGPVIEIVYLDSHGEIISSDATRKMPISADVKAYAKNKGEMILSSSASKLVFSAHYTKDQIIFGGIYPKIRIPKEQLNVNPSIDSNEGAIEVTIYTPEQGSFGDKQGWFVLYPY